MNVVLLTTMADYSTIRVIIRAARPIVSRVFYFKQNIMRLQHNNYHIETSNLANLNILVLTVNKVIPITSNIRKTYITVKQS